MIVRREGKMIRVFGANHDEIAYAVLGISGLKAEVELPSEWSENRRAWVRFGIGVARGAVSIPWFRAYADHGQCSGPLYGFAFHEEYLWLYHGNDTGRPRDGSRTTFLMPWGWRHDDAAHRSLPAGEHDYTYVLRSGEVQKRKARITVEHREWTRPWLPWRRVSDAIWVDFDGEVGERAGSWKGGTTGCGYEMAPGETPLETLRRMEGERKL
mgnify:FL=1|jgi:hypothetical protein